MYPPANIINRLGYERRPIVLVEIPAKVSVGPTTNVVRRIAFSLILVNGMPTIVGVSCRGASGLVSPPPVRSAGHQAIKMVIVVGLITSAIVKAFGSQPSFQPSARKPSMTPPHVIDVAGRPPRRPGSA